MSPWPFDETGTSGTSTQRPWFSYTPVVSDDRSYPGQRGLVGSVAAEHGPWTGHTALVCGSPSMVAHTVDELTGAGTPAADIRFESFGTTTSAGGQQ